MDDLPADLLAVLPESAVSVARKWWTALTVEERERIANLWDNRLEVEFFSRTAEDGEPPSVTGGRFVPSDDDGRSEWQPGYFEHLLQHPELVMAFEPQRRTFHFGCQIEPAARTCIYNGSVPEWFECPLSDVRCPMRQLRGSLLRAI